MVQGVSRAIWTNGCVNCRILVLHTFTAISDISWHSTRLVSRYPKPLFKQQIRLSSGIHQHATIPPENFEHGGKSLPDEGDSEITLDAPTEALNSLQSTQSPWYLQVEAPLRTPQPLSDRQRIPDLPESSPEILQPLLKHISVDLGLDELSLLDLRNLDPPPALGANLLMIIGTARSEKHLHVSADRLCRWLRSEYKLRPDADGLLGRNELKLKMKRRNRRAKLIGSRTVNEDADDGVRTGWVCVNVGTVESSAGADKVELKKNGFIGFGRQTEGVKIVVQMLVEEKREELDLERLWNGIVKRRLLPESGSGDQSVEVAESQSDILHSNSTPSTLGSAGVNYTSSATPFSVKSRGIHTTSRRALPALEPLSSSATSSARIATLFRNPGNASLSSIQQSIAKAIASGDYHAARNLLVDHRLSKAKLQNDEWRTYLLHCLKTHLENISSEQAMKELGQGFKDYSSTPFLSCIYRTISSFPSAPEWEFQIWLYCFARKLGHLGYTSRGLSLLFEQLQLSGVTISNETYLRVLRSILRPRGDSPEALNRLPRNTDLEIAVKILQNMYDRTGNILTEDVFVALQESTAILPGGGSEPSEQLTSAPNAADTTCDLPVLERSGLHSRLDTLMSTLQIRITRDDFRIRLLNIYARQHNWEAFWKLWRSVAREGKPRSAALYACMFQRVAETKHQKGCMNVLRTWIQDMDREVPQVRLEGDVLAAVQACLAVVDPYVEEEKINNWEVKGEWLEIWRRCQQASS